MEVCLSNTDIQKYIPNVILYSDLEDYTIKDLVDSMPLVILYQSTLNTGHWTLLHETPEGLEFFDSYSSMPDEEFKYLSLEQPHYLANLLYELHQKHIPIIFNEYPLQELSPDINTCGRWVILRYLLQKYKIDDFVYGVRELSKQWEMTPDQLVTDIIKK